MEQIELIEQIEPKSAKDLKFIAKTIFEAKVKKVYDYSKIIKAAKMENLLLHVNMSIVQMMKMIQMKIIQNQLWLNMKQLKELKNFLLG